LTEIELKLLLSCLVEPVGDAKRLTSEDGVRGWQALPGPPAPHSRA